MAYINLLVKYINTVKYLKLEQIFFQVYYKYVPRPHLKIKKMQALGNFILNQWEAPVWNQLHLSKDGIFDCYSAQGCIFDPKIWNSTAYQKLWLYHLHYFDDLNAISSNENHQILSAYIAEWLNFNAKIEGNGWEPYPLSLRIVNWIKWFARHGMNSKISLSLNTQARYLIKNIEYHLMANHLFANAKALIFIGAAFQDKKSKNYLKKGLSILDKELKEQFLNDGAHFELSPMYHAILCWDLCDLIYLANLTQNDDLLKRSSRMKEILKKGIEWLAYMTHPDGKISFFNDSAFEVAPTLSNIFEYTQFLELEFKELESTKQYLKDSGYISLKLPNKGKLIVDVGHIGPRYQPGHGHADIMSFEMSLYGQRFLVNSGTSTYEKNSLRAYQRSSQAHNTVVIDNENSSDVWGGFRVAKRVFPMEVEINFQENQVDIQCGYQTLKKNMHHRYWFVHDHCLQIRDEIIGKFKTSMAYFYLHPDVELIDFDSNKIHTQFNSGQKNVIEFENHQSIDIEPVFWYCGFGAKIPTRCIKVIFKQSYLLTKIIW